MMHPPIDLLPAILAALGASNVRAVGHGKWLAVAVWRGGDSFKVTIDAAPDWAGGCKWYDPKEGKGGNGLQLADLLNVPVPRRSARSGPTTIAELQRVQEELERQRAAEVAARIDAMAKLERAAPRYLASCRPAHESPEVVTWLHLRGLDVDTAARAGVLATPRYDAAGPLQLVVPVYDCHGAQVSYRRRAVGPTNGAKEVGRKGDGWHPHGRVYACPLAVRMLAGDAEAVAMVRRCGVVVAEGAPDFLTAVDAWSDADDWAPAVLGVFWPHLDDVPRLWARIPSGTAVLLATDHDEPGHRYAETIGAELLDRCEIHRSNPSPSGAPLDLNDTLRAGGRAAVRALIAAGVFHGWH
jgi:hypothetical protein